MDKRASAEYFVRLLRERYGDKVERVILFGSVARGTYEEDSDVDILVVARDVSQREISDLTWEVLMKTGELISAIVESPDEFDKLRESSFHRTVLREGIPIG